MKKVVIWCLIIALASCEERFDFETDKENETRISINGFINQSTGPYVVNISQTQSSGAPTPIVGATVVLIDEDNNRSNFKESERGVYVNNAEEILGESGKAYWVEVSLLSGQRYLSTPDTIPSLTASYSMTWNEELREFVSDLGIVFDLPAVTVNMDVDLPETDQPLYLNWIGEELYQFVPTDFPDPFGSIPPPCYITQQFGTEKVNLFTNVGFNGTDYAIEDIFWREIDISFLRKHIFSIYQYSTSEQYYNYLKGVESLVENTGSLFDTPPGQIVGNFKAVEGTTENPVGFFSAVLTDTIRIAIYPSELETFIYDECLYRGGFFRDYDQLCVNCLLNPRSTQERPDYWLQY